MRWFHIAFALLLCAFIWLQDWQMACAMPIMSGMLEFAIWAHKRENKPN